MKTSAISQYKRILSLARPYALRLTLAIFASLFATLVWLAVPLGLRELLDAVFDEGNREVLNTITFVLIGLFVTQGFLGFWGSYALDWVGERIVADLRKAVYQHLNQLSLRFFANKRLGEITSRLTNDVAAIRDAVTGTLSEGITQTISLVGSVGLMVYLNWRLSLVIFVTVPILTIAVRYFGNMIRALSRQVQDRLADTTAVAEEALGAIQSVKSFAREAYETGRYNHEVEELFSTARKRVLFSNLFWSSVGMMFLTTMIIIFWYGGTEVLAGRLTAGDLVAFIFFAFNIGRSLGGMSRIYTVFSSAVGASERVFGLLDEVPEISDHPDAITLEKADGAVAFRGVSFSYDEEQPVLKNIDFECSPGDIVALAGPSGAGKTTLLNLIPRFYEAVSGEIQVDGTDVRMITQESLRSHIAVVPQDIQLFGTTIKENIRYGRLDATDEEVMEAAVRAQADAFIRQHPDGYDAKVGEKGIKLSGGQRQRIAIARAILKQPRILLLDEATSSLDSESEAAVQQALNDLMTSCTTFVIAHRLSTIQNATTILVMESGEIVQRGSHEQLLDEGGLYKRLHDIQFRKAEYS
ncbi:MAG: ATP-binding cassette domain-containing protein [Balneolia bacterium]|nr:ATP-binding cassette domain-containing protein [Balneolia bacterium]